MSEQPKDYICLIAIGNSDDKLPQHLWSAFQLEVRMACQENNIDIFGAWHSYPDSIWQNAAISARVDADQLGQLKDTLAAIARHYNQDSIAFNIMTETEFLGRDEE